MPMEISQIEVLESPRNKPALLRVGLTNELYRGDICQVTVTGKELSSYFGFAQAVKQQTRIDFRYTHASHGASDHVQQREWEDHLRACKRVEPEGDDDGTG